MDYGVVEKYKGKITWNLGGGMLATNCQYGDTWTIVVTYIINGTEYTLCNYSSTDIDADYTKATATTEVTVNKGSTILIKYNIYNYKLGTENGPYGTVPIPIFNGCKAVGDYVTTLYYTGPDIYGFYNANWSIEIEPTSNMWAFSFYFYD